MQRILKKYWNCILLGIIVDQCDVAWHVVVIVTALIVATEIIK